MKENIKEPTINEESEVISSNDKSQEAKTLKKSIRNLKIGGAVAFLSSACTLTVSTLAVDKILELENNYLTGETIGIISSLAGGTLIIFCILLNIQVKEQKEKLETIYQNYPELKEKIKRPRRLVR